MQTKKDDLRKSILLAARHEFLVHGFQNSSLRQIAQKANTTSGNIYHYFKNKDELLDEILLPMIAVLDAFLKEHVNDASAVHSIEEIDQALAQIDLESPTFDILMSDELVIFMKCEEARYVVLRSAFMKRIQTHMAWHMKVEPDNHFVEIICNMVIDCVIHLSRCNACVHDRKADFIKVFRMLCKGVIEPRL